MNPIHGNFSLKTKYLLLTLVTLFMACANPDSRQTNPVPTKMPASSLEDAGAEGGNVLRIFNPDTPTILNPYFSLGIQDFEPSRIVYEPLASFDKDGNLVPILAAEIPSLENGELAANNKTVIWKLRQDVRWSDGEPFTSDDVVFTYSYIINPGVKAIITSEYSQVANIEALDDYTIKVTFKDVNPAWALPFTGIRGVILPKHIFKPYKGANAREAHANMVPVGTGPYRVTESGIEPQEILLFSSQMVKTTKIVFKPNPYYRFPDKIAFEQVVWLGGGDRDEANRLLFEEGNIHVIYKAVVTQTPADSKGKLLFTPPPGVVRILLNFTDPNKPSAEGEYSSLQVPHPLFSDKRVRQAIAYAINRRAIVDNVIINGAPANAILVAPLQYLSTTVFYEYDPEKAKTLLDEAGYIDTDGDGFREKDGRGVKILIQSFVAPTEQEIQKIIKENLNAVGIDVELKAIDSGIMFGAGTSKPDSVSRFNADLMIFQTRSNNFDPTAFMDFWTCKQIPQKANNWTAGNNNERWCNPAYDSLLEQTKTELVPRKRQAMFIQLNDMLVEDVAMIPLAWKKNIYGISKNLTGLDSTPWDSLTWNIQDWHFDKP